MGSDVDFGLLGVSGADSQFGFGKGSGGLNNAGLAGFGIQPNRFTSMGESDMMIEMQPTAHNAPVAQGYTDDLEADLAADRAAEDIELQNAKSTKEMQEMKEMIKRQSKEMQSMKSMLGAALRTESGLGITSLSTDEKMGASMFNVVEDEDPGMIEDVDL